MHVAQPPDAGVPAVVAHLVRDQVRRGWRVTVVCPHESELRVAAPAAGARALDWEAGRAPGPSTLGETRRLAGLISADAPDIVHLHSAKAGLAGRLALRGARPTVFQPHAWSFEAARGPVAAAALAWERTAARWADAIVCVSSDERERGRQAAVRGRWAVIPNGVDLDAWPASSPAERAAARRELGLGERPLAVLVGRLAEQKGQDVLLRAWPAVRRTVPAAELILVGDGPDRAALESLGTTGVRFVGRRTDVGAWLAAADVAVLPSRWEAGSLVVMEAMARARSVVATSVGGMREALGPDAGAIVPPDAPAPLAQEVAERLLDVDRADAEGRAGRLRIETHFDVRVSTARVAELYETVLDRRGRSTAG